jgi:hypothetical protein
MKKRKYEGNKATILPDVTCVTSFCCFLSGGIVLNKKMHHFGWSAGIGYDQLYSFNDPYAVKE